MKKFFVFIFKSLFSNKEAIKGKNQPLWAAFIIAFISLICAALPTVISVASSKGESLITSSTNSSLDISLPLFSKYLKDENIVLRVQDKELVTTFTETVIKAQDKDLLAVKYAATDAEIKEAQDKFQKHFVFTSDDGVVTTGPISYIIITNTDFYAVTYKSETQNNYNSDGTLKSYASSTSTYSGKINQIDGMDFASFYDESEGVDAKDNCVNKWKTALNKMYKPVRTNYLFLQSGIITALNAGVMLIVTLMLFLLSKLKSNLGEKFTFVEALKVTLYASFCPALLTLIIGSFISMVATIGLVLFLGIRSTFLGMKASTPADERK
ncbi:MAG: hypothetical protein ACI4U5_04310 [Bacilli bacterium]